MDAATLGHGFLDLDRLALQDGVDADQARRFYGTTRALIASAVKGVSAGYSAKLKLEGTGYKAELKGSLLNLSLGLSHPVNYEVPKGLVSKVIDGSKNTQFTLESFDNASARLALEIDQYVATQQEIERRFAGRRKRIGHEIVRRKGYERSNCGRHRVGARGGREVAGAQRVLDALQCTYAILPGGR